MKKLHVTFTNAKGKKHKWIPATASLNLTKAQVEEAANKLVALDMFESKGVELFKSFDSVKYVEVIETELV